MDDEQKTGPKAEQAPDDVALAKEIAKRIAADREFFKDDFKRMRENQHLARKGASKHWVKDGNYVANLIFRHIKQMTAALYAKDPTPVARRPDRLDFQVWDEDPQSMMMAVQTLTMAAQTADPFTGMSPVVPPDAVMQAQELMADIQQGMAARQRAKKIGKTLELLFKYYQREQTPVDFKTAMKGVVRRTLTNGVGYVELGFQREYEDGTPDMSSGIADVRGQLQSISALAYEVQDSDAPRDVEENEDAKTRELGYAVQGLQQQEYVLQREGLVFDFPQALKVIPDKATKSLVGFHGSRWLTVEYDYTPSEILAKFGRDAKQCREQADDDLFRDEADDDDQTDVIRVWKHYDKTKGLVYYVADGVPGFLRPPAAPDVFVEGFFPVFALAFNECDDETSIFPPSDVELLRHMQHDYNTSRQGKREHRMAARPRFALSSSAGLGDQDKANLQAAEAFSVTELSMPPEADIRAVLQAFPIPGVDPNLYDVNETFTDVQLAVGSQEAQFGGVAKATATESSIAEGSRLTAVGLNADDMDDFLTRIARAAGQILLVEMSPETVQQIVGAGAFWPTMGLDEVAAEVTLEIEAGSSGKPNRTVELQNWERMMPFLLQMPNIGPEWLARETVRRLDDRLDLTEAFVDNMPSIVAQNRGGALAGPGGDPAAQGAEGADNGPRPPGGPSGTDAPGGNNQV